MGQGSARALAAYQRLALRVEAWPLERVGLFAIAVGVLLRVVAPFVMDLRSDGNTYVAMGHAWMLTQSFLMPWGDVTTWGPVPAGHSHHYPPAYPFFLGVVFKLFGFGLWQAKIAAVAVSLAALAAVYGTTRDLHGPLPAAIVTGLLALEPHLLWVTGTGFSENMVLLFFALTMWAIVKSLQDDRWVVLAGLFAGLAYLSRASVGYFFVVAGAGGFLWRFAYRRWRLFTNVWYLAAIVVFLGIVGAWARRNVMLFGWPNWQTSSYTSYVTAHAWDHWHLWQHALAMKVPLFIGFFLVYALPFAPEALRSAGRIRDERTSALWLSVFLVWVIAWVISAMFWTYERSPMYWLDNHRYVVIGVLPLAWLVMHEARLARASTRLRIGMLFMALLALCLASMMTPVQFADIRAAEALDEHLQPGDSIGVSGRTMKYAFYAYLSEPETVAVHGCLTPPPICGFAPEFILTLLSDAYDGYVRIDAHSVQDHRGRVVTATTWARADVADARGLAQTPILPSP